ncbi:hypothetical protein FOA43_004061 [Brettanomyces nanus]|uniref:Elongator complex protein 4 n=1 Tax=Eeniella nana TaxID=13502 RepID=A0A875RX36_EENNA|nr:uncharacterized protein FOA43_004061 [Brettanomyces nanus]QPG76667.1 hypothetical protein FOA43_004061 [Brettanomyces nanus]
MSFRRRGEILSRSERIITGSLREDRVPTRRPVSLRRGGGLSGPNAPRALGILGTAGTTGTQATQGTPDLHLAIKPSLLTSTPTTSTGSVDIDLILGHQGLPLGSSLLVEEDGATDFASTLIKLFLAQGVVHNRISSSGATHDIVVGVPWEWAASLPGIYKGSTREQKRKKLEQIQKRISVTNVIDQQSEQSSDLKIAWRYGLQQRQQQQQQLSTDTETDPSSQYPSYNSSFDITTNLVPAANPKELSCIPIGDSYNGILSQINSVIQRYSDKLIRIALPLFLNPMVYSGDNFLNPCEVIRFLHSLKSILKRHKDRVVMMITLNLDLYPRDSAMVTIIESSLIDGVIELKPFDPELYEYLERIYRKQPTKVKHGHLNVYKIPILSDLGLMKVSEMELCFKNGKKRFEVERWSIPVDEGETEDKDEIKSPSQLDF